MEDKKMQTNLCNARKEYLRQIQRKYIQNHPLVTKMIKPARSLEEVREEIKKFREFAKRCKEKNRCQNNL